MPSALITGVDGQDGSYLAELLLSKGYRVLGTRRNRRIEPERALHVPAELEVIEADLLDEKNVENVLRKYRPDEVYNLAARASSNELWSQPLLTGDLNALAVTRILEGICKLDGKTRFIQASSSEMFGGATEVPQTERTPFHPRNPYGAAKAYGHWTTVVYREQRALFACSAILYNHESPRRGLEFVTRKVSHAVAQIKMGLTTELRLGNLDSQRDWGFAGDYVRAMWLALQQPVADDYIVATGEIHSVRELCDIAFSYVGLNYQDYVVENHDNSRRPETTVLVGDPSKAKRCLGWSPAVTFRELVQMMVDADLKSIQGVRQAAAPLVDGAYHIT